MPGTKRQLPDFLRHPLDPEQCETRSHVFTHVLGPFWDRSNGADVYCCDNCGEMFYLLPQRMITLRDRIRNRLGWVST